MKRICQTKILLFQREIDCKRCAVISGRGHSQVSVVVQNNLFSNRQTQAGAADFHIFMNLHAVKFFGKAG